jgi:hypothetical protein
MLILLGILGSCYCCIFLLIKHIEGPELGANLSNALKLSTISFYSCGLIILYPLDWKEGVSFGLFNTAPAGFDNGILEDRTELLQRLLSPKMFLMCLF